MDEASGSSPLGSTNVVPMSKLHYYLLGLLLLAICAALADLYLFRSDRLSIFLPPAAAAEQKIWRHILSGDLKSFLQNAGFSYPNAAEGLENLTQVAISDIYFEADNKVKLTLATLDSKAAAKAYILTLEKRSRDWLVVDVQSN